MRTIFLLVICSLFSLNISAGQFGHASDGFRVTELNFQNSLGEKGITYFKYDNDKLCKSYWSLNNKKRSSINYYEYNSDGLIISAFREFSDGITSNEVFKYDSLGNLMSEYFFRSDSIKGSASYTYKNGALTEVEFNKHKGWLNGKMKIEYDNSDRKIRGSIYDGNSAICNVDYKYDQYGNLIKETWDFNGRYSQEFKYNYENINQSIKYYYSSPYLNNKSNYRVAKEEYTFNNKTGGPSLYTYSKEGLLKTKKFIRSDSLATFTTYKYDTQRRLVSSARKYSDGKNAFFNYTYDERNNLVLREFFKDGELIGFESYLYNSAGELIKAYLNNFDNWLTGTINYTRDQFGRISSGKFKSDEGFSADINFEYNEINLLSEIKWLFSFGKFQQYNFQYEKHPILKQ